MKQAHQTWAVVPAAGSGSRMVNSLAKQYLPLAGTSLLENTLSIFLASDDIQGIILVLSSYDTHWQSLSLAKHPKIHTVSGGETRSQSVTHALEYLFAHTAEADREQVWVCVHDAARPCLSSAKLQALLSHCFASQVGAILAVPIDSTVKRAEGASAFGEHARIARTEKREALWLAQTPQMFRLAELLDAMKFCEENGVLTTDEAAAIEQVGGQVDLLPDRKDNIKVTVPEDLALAEFILKKNREPQT